MRPVRRSPKPSVCLISTKQSQQGRNHANSRAEFLGAALLHNLHLETSLIYEFSIVKSINSLLNDVASSLERKIYVNMCMS